MYNIMTCISNAKFDSIVTSGLIMNYECTKLMCV